ncbi:flagellar hook-associated protein FlgL [Anoxybacillus flavithermus]|uniref:flagellar hook-associated protein FlgL n=1 Tax=Anoxybacillus flavithermus TaxID=33934 RepID=UPI000B29C2A9|nr:flagellar hook-associated protein FlgL [Anoxybacillus flavithermus]MBE2940844.1 flagellar hook-associated protein FlgL [Anoxybacillus flavithermus]MBE2943533.1 flagellar hook-associated protein FlgL [Anoxybacillus flavithermus]MBE2951830.1 flagellar hook-associated protein FlgL [Anoxybacillus flavithermus]MBE2954421.1 flagellar hook-associated protein FlgL [Anoxybacillus flavithermus]MBE2959857.1 flagellar hook-associated protein FlgL [Anoxybacillus flavithermus]
MRVTQGMLTGNMLRNLSASYARLGKYQDQLATGKKINRPSDDPVIAMKGMIYRTNLTEVEQFKRNFSEAYNWIENSDAALDKATQALQRIRELVVQASNDTYEVSQRAAISEEIKQLTEHLASIANTKVGDKYIFNGADTLKQPVDLSQALPVVSKNTDEIKIELSKGIYIPVNVNPTKVFNYDNTAKGNGLFSDLEFLNNDLNDATKSGKDINQYLGYIDKHINSFLSARAELGARLNRIELMEERIDQQEVIANRILSDNEDADIERVITDLKTQESVHRAALGVGARIIQPTLLDFLR